MPTISEIVENLKKIQETRRQQNRERIEKRWLQVTNTVPEMENEEENIEIFPVEQIKVQNLNPEIKRAKVKIGPLIGPIRGQDPQVVRDGGNIE